MAPALKTRTPSWNDKLRKQRLEAFFNKIYDFDWGHMSTWDVKVSLLLEGNEKFGVHMYQSDESFNPFRDDYPGIGRADRRDRSNWWTARHEQERASATDDSVADSSVAEASGVEVSEAALAVPPAECWPSARRQSSPMPNMQTLRRTSPHPSRRLHDATAAASGSQVSAQQAAPQQAVSPPQNPQQTAPTEQWQKFDALGWSPTSSFGVTQSTGQYGLIMPSASGGIHASTIPPYTGKYPEKAHTRLPSDTMNGMGVYQ
ncbi:hypothetical protein NA57DRAFT_72226 [Rhizodiscina lignyota]|uniref:Uncharacterized protein n=1 Tax=Rhizodiscina lignyota TaxID=1504668 RepID=A0A9P4IKJ4_9PEZI|nr:hypothetical protein NA57DRAFT_72226 [Rhizodiscina lignyota]